jgi:hypothetical protein
MPPSPEKNPLEDIDLDFTKEGKLKDLRTKIEAAERGIALAEKLNDMDRLGELMAKLQGFKETEKVLLAEKDGEPKQEFWADSQTGGEDPFSQAVGREYGGSIDKMDKRGF